MSVPVAAEKACTRCGEVKNLAEFYKRSASADGRMWECKGCSKARVNAYNARKRSEDPEAWRERNRAAVQRVRATNPASVQRNRMQNKAQRLAEKRLRELHPDAYRHLLEVAKRELGL